MDLLTTALRYGGTREIKGDKDNPLIVEWFAIAGARWIKDDEHAWCSAFACAIAAEAGYHHPRTVRARKWMNLTIEQATPVRPEDLLPGDAVVYRRRSAGHVGFYLCRNRRNDIWTIGGNQGDEVKPKVYELEDLIGAFRLNRQCPSAP
jgi:uncharacterized protein (TIGR02594 family)